MSKRSDSPTTLTVSARAPFEVYYEGPALSVTAVNRIGKFDILAGHADFFSMLVPCDCIVTTEDSTVTFPIKNGIVTVRDNGVMLFVNI